MTVTDVPASNPAFPVHWDDPADAYVTYTTDMFGDEAINTLLNSTARH